MHKAKLTRFPENAGHHRGRHMLSLSLSSSQNHQTNALSAVQLGGPRDRRSSVCFNHRSHDQVLEAILKKWRGDPEELFEPLFWKKRVRGSTDSNRFKTDSAVAEFANSVMLIFLDDENSKYINRVLKNFNVEQKSRFEALLLMHRNAELSDLANQANVNRGTSTSTPSKKVRKYAITISSTPKVGQVNAAATTGGFENQTVKFRGSSSKRCLLDVVVMQDEDHLPSRPKVERRNSKSEDEDRVPNRTLTRTRSLSKPTSPTVAPCGDEINARVRRSSSKPPVPPVITTYEKADGSGLEDADETVRCAGSDSDSGDNFDKENCSVSEKVIKRYPKPPSAPPLTVEMLEVIQKALEKSPKEVVVSGFAKKVLQEDLAIIRNEKEWLADVNIDFYLELIRERSKLPGYPSVYVFHSYFFPLLYGKEGGGYGAVKETTGDDDIFEYDLIFIPINWQHHWRLVVVECSKKRLLSYDSLLHSNKFAQKEIVRYLNKEHRRRHPDEYMSEQGSAQVSVDEMNNNSVKADKETGSKPSADAKEIQRKKFINCPDWSIGDFTDNIPMQHNSVDCGIFILQYAEYLSREMEFDFDQSHIRYFRKRMMFETLTKTLLTSI